MNTLTHDTRSVEPEMLTTEERREASERLVSKGGV